MKDFLTLYGVKVPRQMREPLKEIADILCLQTYTNVPLREARKHAVVVAMESFVKMAKLKGGKGK